MAKYPLLKHYRGVPAAVNDVPSHEQVFRSRVRTVLRSPDAGARNGFTARWRVSRFR